MKSKREVVVQTLIRGRTKKLVKFMMYENTQTSTLILNTT